MDILLSRVTQHAMNYAIRSGVTIATGYTIKQCGRLIQQSPKSQERAEIAQLQTRLEGKIRIISPAIDMIELISARGHTSLESAVSLTKDIRLSIQNLGTQLRVAAEEQDLIHRRSKRARAHEDIERVLKNIIKEMKLLIEKIDDAVPLVNLAITTSGVNLSTKLATTVSPSRLLQASTFLTAADSMYTTRPGERVQVGPTFVVSLYMLFAGHASRAVDEAGIRETTWKEVLHKAHVKLVRLSLDQCCKRPGEVDVLDGDTFRESTRSAEFAYQLVIIEDLDDGRVHNDEHGEEPVSFDGVGSAGIRDIVPIHQISKLFYADTGKILNIRGDDEDNTPILLLKRDVDAPPPRRMTGHSPGTYEDESSPTDDASASLLTVSKPNSSRWKLPVNLDPEWMALEVFEAFEDSDGESHDEDTDSSLKRQSGSSLNDLFSALSMRRQTSSPGHSVMATQHVITELQSRTSREAGVKTSLSLLEMLIKLTALQQFRQESHLAIEDELLNFFLEESATAGAGGDKSRRQRLRQHAIKKVGFDPYDESPIKRRGEVYIQDANTVLQPSSPSDRGYLDNRSTPLRSQHSPQIVLSSPPRPGHRTPLLAPTAVNLIQHSPSPLSLADDGSSRPHRVGAASSLSDKSLDTPSR